MELLRDPIWQFAGAAIGVAAIIASIYMFLRQRAVKSLGYEILTQTELLSIKKEIKSKVQVTYAGKPVENVHLVTIRISNDGNVPISASNYERPLSFSFNDKATILSADITEVSPKSLKPLIGIESSKVILEPMLLNSGDTIQVSLLLAEHDGKIESDARIEGVSEVKGEIISPLKPVVKIGIALGVTVIIGITLLYIFVEEYRFFILMGLLVVFAMGANIFEVYLKKRRSEARHRN